MSFLGDFVWAGCFQPPPKKQKKATKPKASNWFEKCTVDQLKQLSRASLSPVSGTKADLVRRLLEGELTSRFSFEYAPERSSYSVFDCGYMYTSDDDGGDFGPSRKRKKAPTGVRRPDGTSTACLKIECGEKGLVKSGNRFDLVLRLLQNETSKQTGVEPTKAKGSILDPETGKYKAKPRAKSMKLPDPSKLGERVRKKAYPPDSVKYKWSNMTSKYHLHRCLELALDLIQKEVVDKKLFERGEEKLAWEVVKEVTRWCFYYKGMVSMHMDEGVRGMGYCSFEISRRLCPKLIEFVKLTTDKKKLSEWGMLKIFTDLPRHSRAYGFELTEFEDELKLCLPDYQPSPAKLESLFN